MASNWLEICRAEHIDPDEVRIVYSRFEAYQRFNQARADEPELLAKWFGFYRLEKASEGEQAGPAPAGCSVDSDAVNNACIQRPVQFLRALRAYRLSQLADG